MKDRQLANSILAKYTAKYPQARDLAEYTEYVYDMNRAELEFENTLIADVPIHELSHTSPTGP